MMAICLISAITGNIDVPGGLGSSIPVGPPLIPTKGIDSLADRTTPEIVDKLVGPEFPKWYQMKGNTTSAYFKGMNSILTGKPFPMRALCGQHTNPFGATRQPKVVAEALKKLEFYFVMDINWNPSTAYADIVLPASSLYERDHQFGVKNMAEGTWIGIRNIIVEPQGESRSDWQFWCDLAVKMGYGADFWNGSFDDCLREQLDGSGVTLEDLRASPTGIFVARTKAPAPPTYRRYETLFKNLPHGKVQCYNERIGGKEDCLGIGTLPYFPEYKGAPESITNTPDLAKGYPLVLSDVHAYRLCQHSSLVNLAYLRELQPTPWVRINPDTAKKYGIGDGDWMKVESPHGWIKMTAEYFPGIAPDVLMTRRGWWLECEELNLPAYDIGDGGSEVNVMYGTDIENDFDRFASQMPKQTLVKISKL
jgi:thiosulfate reductase/polysulfide reductase chain A